MLQTLCDITECAKALGFDATIYYSSIKDRSILGLKLHSGSLSAQYVFYEAFKFLGLSSWYLSETFKIFVLLYTYTNAHMVTL